MAFEAGSRLGGYEIAVLIGAGGMGEVYRARDTRLSRDVAIKVLPAGLIDDADRRARFEREAQVLASLNHAGIATIHGVEEFDPSVALVMELVEGPTLAERIAAGPVPLDEALPIARQICEALEYAHERGVIHRDLKPANIKVRPDGAVKLLDFGLAKALDPGRQSDVTNATNSPTLSLAGTRAGVILGTAAYMAPEQARGGTADRRADVWAFGCVLFEMLAGKPPFSGGTMSDTLAAVLRSDPEWTALPASTPPLVRRLLRRCLQKDLRKRLHHIGDARLDLEDVDASLTTPDDARPPVNSRPRLFAIAGAFAAGAAIAGAAAWVARPSSPVRRVARVSLPIPATMPLRSLSADVTLALSPLGDTIVFTQVSGAVRGGLARRRLDETAFTELRSVDPAANAPFFSPDGAWIAFFAPDGTLKKIPSDGSIPATTICNAPPAGSRGTWGDDGSIVFADSRGNLSRVASAGGTPETLVTATSQQTAAFEPHMMPGSKALLVRSAGLRDRALIDALELPSLRRHSLLAGRLPQLAPSGDLVFEREGKLWAVGFDARRFAVVGTPVTVVDSVRVAADVPLFSVGRDGSLAYMAGVPSISGSLVWLDRTGRSTAAVAGEAPFEGGRVSPDGSRIAATAQSPDGNDIWIYDVERGTRLRLTTSANNRRPIWSPDGKRIAFWSDAAGDGPDLFVLPADGGSPQELLRRPGIQFPDVWSPDGRFILFNEIGATFRDIYALPLSPVGLPRAVVSTPFNERGVTMSPDGGWIAFVSDETGRDEVYLQPFAGDGAKLPMSRNGGTQPRWSRNGREIFYREGQQLMAVAVQTSPLRLGAAARLFEFDGRIYGDDPNLANYDVAPDGRFLAIKRMIVAGPDEIHVVLNWTEELRRALKR